MAAFDLKLPAQRRSNPQPDHIAPSEGDDTFRQPCCVLFFLSSNLDMLAPLARRIVLARPVATAFQTRPFSASTPNNDTAVVKVDNSAPTMDLSDYKRPNPTDMFADVADSAARVELSKIRDLEDEMVSSVSAEVEPIEWDQWRKDIRYPGLVDELKVLHDATPVPDVEAEKQRLQKIVEDTFNPMLVDLQQMAQDAEVEAQEFEKQADEMNYLHDNLREMSVDEFLEKYPSVKESIEKDIEGNRWFTEE